MRITKSIKFFIILLIVFFTFIWNITCYADNTLQDSIGVEFSASVGNNTLNENSEVKEGEIITYSIKLTNNQQNKLENISIRATIPENTELIKVNSNYLADKGELIVDPATGESKSKTAQIANEPSKGRNDKEQYFQSVSDSQIIKNNISLEAGETVTNTFSVRVKQGLQGQSTQVVILEVTDGNSIIEKRFSHKFNKANIKIELLPITRLGTGEIVSGATYSNLFVITNLTNSVQKNLQFEITKSDSIKINGIWYSIGKNSVNINEEQLTLIIPELGANSVISGEIDFTPNLTQDQAQMTVSIKDQKQNMFRSNKLTESINGIKIETDLQAVTEKQEEVLTPGEKIKYTIKLKNTGKIDAKNLTVADYISDYIEVVSFKLNGNEVKYESEEDENVLTIETGLDVDEEATIEIIAKTDEDLPTTESFQITNYADIYNNSLVAQTDNITHYMNFMEDTEERERADAFIEENEEKVPNKQNDKIIYIILGIVLFVLICIGVYVKKKKNKNKRED